MGRRPKEKQWDVFDQVGTRANESFVSLQKRRSIGISSMVCAKHQINEGDYNYVKLAFDRTNKRMAIGFLKLKSSQKGCFRLIFNKASCFIGAASFLAWFQLYPEIYAGKYYNVWEESIPGLPGKALVVDLARKALNI